MLLQREVAQLVVMLLPITSVASACRRQVTPVDPAILTLGEETVRRSDFDAHVRRIETTGGSTLDDAVRAAVLDSFLDERLLVLEARRRGRLPPGAGPEAERAAVQALVADEVLSDITVTEEAIAELYHSQRESFARPERRTVRQILVPTLNEARDMHRRLLRDPKGFEILARTHSTAPEASVGGLMGTFIRGELPPELEAVVFSLNPSKPSHIVETAFGFHILRVDVVKEAAERSIEECRAEIRHHLFRRESDRHLRLFIGGLMTQAKVNHEAATLPLRTR